MDGDPSEDIDPDDPGEPEESAHAETGIVANTPPTPNATASAPTRPIPCPGNGPTGNHRRLSTTLR